MRRNLTGLHSITPVAFRVSTGFYSDARKFETKRTILKGGCYCGKRYCKMV
jgi:hypothetical protein